MADIEQQAKATITSATNVVKADVSKVENTVVSYFEKYAVIVIVIVALVAFILGKIV